MNQPTVDPAPRSPAVNAAGLPVSPLAARLHATSRVLALAIITIGFVTALTWFAPSGLVTELHGSGSSITLGTGIAFVLGGLTVQLAQRARRGATGRILMAVADCSMLGVAAAGATLAHLGDLSSRGIGGLLAVSAPAAILFAALGAALLALDVEDRAGRRPAQIACMVVALFATTTLGASLLSGAAAARGAAPPLLDALASLTFLLFALAVLFARADRGPMGVVTADAVGGEVARRLLPPAALTPVLLLVLCYVGYLARLYEATVGLILLTTLNSAVLTALVWRAAVALNQSDAGRKALERERNDLNVRLQRAMAETHHRVRNNLQIITALADMQVLQGADSVPVSEMRRISAQVQALAAVHEILTREAKHNTGMETVSAREVLDQLAGLLQRTTTGRSIVVDAEDARISGRQASALVVIANELITNALKYSDSDVRVSFQESEARGKLIVEDRGPGFAEQFNPITDSNTGLDLVQQIARWDLQGAIEFANGPEGGARVVVDIPLASHSMTTVT